MSDDQAEKPEDQRVDRESVDTPEARSESDRAASVSNRVGPADSLLPAPLVERVLAQYANMASKPWMQAYAASNIAQNVLGGQASSIMRNYNHLLGAKGMLSAMQPALKLNLAQGIGAAIAPSAALTNIYRSMSTMTNPEGVSAFAPALASLANALVGIQASARSALLAGFATKTQEFLTTDRALRYRSNWPVWHYTNGHALLSILRTGQLWASSPQHLNDASEMTHGFEILRQALSGRMEEAEAGDLGDVAGWGAVKETMAEVLGEDYVLTIIHDVYYISASMQRDSLTLWRNYADGDGFAVGIDASVGLSADGFAVGQANEDGAIRADVPLISGWYRVTYKQSSKQKLAEGFIQSAIEDINGTAQTDLPELVRELQKQAVILASSMKHEAFKDEQEVRWMTTNFTMFDPVHYEHVRRSIAPVLKVMTSSPESDQALPLKGLWCSPISDEGIVRTIEGLFRQQGYLPASKNVHKSRQPFRG